MAESRHGAVVTENRGNICGRSDVAHQGLPEAEWQIIREVYEEGASLTEIGRQYEVSAQAVFKQAKKRGWIRANPKASDVQTDVDTATPGKLRTNVRASSRGARMLSRGRASGIGRRFVPRRCLVARAPSRPPRSAVCTFAGRME